MENFYAGFVTLKGLVVNLVHVVFMNCKQDCWGQKPTLHSNQTSRYVHAPPVRAQGDVREETYDPLSKNSSTFVEYCVGLRLTRLGKKGLEEERAVFAISI